MNLLVGLAEKSFVRKQAETDTVLFSMCNQTLNSENADVYIQGCYVSNNVDGEQLKMKNKK